MSLSEIALSLFLALNPTQTSMQGIKQVPLSCEQIVIENVKKNYPEHFAKASETDLKRIVNLQEENCKSFLKAGIRAKTLTEVPFNKVKSFLYQLEKGEISHDWISFVGTNDDFEKYYVDFAKSDPDFEKDHDWIKNHLIERLSKKEHKKRVTASYSEHYKQILGIYDLPVLFILKSYLDFFDAEKGRKVISDLFEVEKNSDERGGLFFNTLSGLEFVEFKNQIRGKKAKGSYSVTNLEQLVPNIGSLHTHPIENYSSSILAGPSGYVILVGFDTSAYFSNDLGVQRRYRAGRARAVDIVVTELGNSEYNVDAYFRKTHQRGNSVVAKDTPIVIDLGIFKVEPMKK